MPVLLLTKRGHNSYPLGTVIRITQINIYKALRTVLSMSKCCVNKNLAFLIMLEKGLSLSEKMQFCSLLLISKNWVHTKGLQLTRGGSDCIMGTIESINYWSLNYFVCYLLKNVCSCNSYILNLISEIVLSL